ARAGSFEAGDHPQQCGLAATGRTQQSEELTLDHRQRDFIDGSHITEALCYRLEFYFKGGFHSSGRDYNTARFRFGRARLLQSRREKLMADQIKIYQKPTCSKCREAIGILKERGVDFKAINYYETPLDSDQLRELIEQMGIAPRY